mgnify:CR=1 FL=1|jgi:hypothetical protein
MKLRIERSAKPEFSKRLVMDIRALLWVVTLGGLAPGSILHPCWVHRLFAVDQRHGWIAMDRSWGRL